MKYSRLLHAVTRNLRQPSLVRLELGINATPYSRELGILKISTQRGNMDGKESMNRPAKMRRLNHPPSDVPQTGPIPKYLTGTGGNQDQTSELPEISTLLPGEH